MNIHTFKARQATPASRDQFAVIEHEDDDLTGRFTTREKAYGRFCEMVTDGLDIFAVKRVNFVDDSIADESEEFVNRWLAHHDIPEDDNLHPFVDQYFDSTISHLSQQIEARHRNEMQSMWAE